MGANLGAGDIVHSNHLEYLRWLGSRAMERRFERRLRFAEEVVLPLKLPNASSPAAPGMHSASRRSAGVSVPRSTTSSSEAGRQTRTIAACGFYRTYLFNLPLPQILDLTHTEAHGFSVTDISLAEWQARTPTRSRLKTSGHHHQPNSQNRTN